MKKQKPGVKSMEPIIGKAVLVNVSIDEPTRETLKQVGYNNISAGIRILARQHREGKK